MAAIARRSLLGGDDPWLSLVRLATEWCDREQVAPQDAIVLVPFAQHLPLARKAWARTSGWMPRIETTQTLSRSLGPAVLPAAGEISFDASLDRLVARRMLTEQGWANAWSRRDPKAFEESLGALVNTAQALARAAACVAPADREAHWAAARTLLSFQSGPGATERSLARLALEWAASTRAMSSDRLHEIRPSAWIVLQAGGADPLALAIARHRPCLMIDSDVPLDDPFAGNAGRTDATLCVCESFEAEAERTAAETLRHLCDGAFPVALIAQDRMLVRRVRALLSRQQVPLADETGWKLSTTRAGAMLVGLLRAASPRATTDDWLDWFKSSTSAWPGLDAPRVALSQLEAALRKAGTANARDVAPSTLPPRAAALWTAALGTVESLREVTLRPLATWLQVVRQALESSGGWTALMSDEAGRQVVAALYLSDDAPVLRSGDSSPLTLDDLMRWLDEALEAASYLPTAPEDAAVIVTPLERAMLRPFAAVVFPGCDEKRLGAAPSPHPLLDDASAVSLGLRGAAERRDAEMLAFAQLLKLPRVSLLRRVDEAGELIAESPLLARLAMARDRAGLGPLPAPPDVRVERPVAPRPVPHPLPSAAALLPAQLSASACEALRACPYRFFALRMLKLREADELDDEVQKRDYGTWLHAVLQQFHATRSAPASAEVEQERLREVAEEVRKSMGLDEATFLPYAASFARLAPRYGEWMHARDAAGVQWLDAEVDLRASPTAWKGISMQGVIDRVDSVPGSDGPVTQLIDYKTGSATELRNKVKRPQEDTQLAFYAALMAEQSSAGGNIGAMYLALDDGDRITQIEHPDVEATAGLLLDGLAHDFDQLRRGVPMPALGQGRACEFCEARGLCRRDHWQPEESPL